MRIEELLEGVKTELAVKIYGDDQKVMDSIATQIQQAVSGIEGLERPEIESQLGQAQITIRPDYLALSRYGINVDEVMRVIRNGIEEDLVTEKIEGIRRFDIVSKIKGAKKDIASIKAVLLRSKTGKMVRLDEVCDIRVVQGLAFIKRGDLSRYMVLSMEVEDRDIASFVKEADEKIRKEVEIPSNTQRDSACVLYR